MSVTACASLRHPFRLRTQAGIPRIPRRTPTSRLWRHTFVHALQSQPDGNVQLHLTVMFRNPSPPNNAERINGYMDVQVAPGLKQATADKIVRGLNPHLNVGERIRVLAPVMQFRPSIDGIAITNNRILGFSSYTMPGKRPAISIPLEDVEGIDYEGKLSGTRIRVRLSNGSTVRLGTVAPADVSFVRTALAPIRAGQSTGTSTASPSTASTEKSHSKRTPGTSESRSDFSRSPRREEQSTTSRSWTFPRVLAAVLAGFFVLRMLGAAVGGEHISTILRMAALVVPLAWYGIVTPLRRRHAKQHAKPQPVTPTPMKLTIGAVFLGLVVAAASTAPEGVDSTANSTTSTNSESPESAPSTTDRTEDSAPPPPSVEFTDDMVRAHGVSKDEKGGQSNVRFVGNSDDPTVLAALTEQCIDHFLTETAAAYCYAYGSDADYDHKTFDWTPEFDESVYGGSRPCWVAYGGQPIAGRDSRTLDTKSGFEYVTADCPGTVAYPDPDGALATERQHRAAIAAEEAGQDARDACALVDTEVLARHGFATTLDGGIADPRFNAEGAARTYTCQNSEMELTFTVTEYPTAEPAAAAASETLATPNSFLLEDGGFVTDLPGGAAVVNEAFGLSEATWLIDRYTIDVTLSSQPPISGLSGGQTAPQLVDVLETLAATTNNRLPAGQW